MPIKGKKIDAINNPKNIKNLFLQISERYPKNGCIKDEHKCDKLKINVDKANEIPKLLAIKGIIGLTNPEYVSTAKCPAQSVFTAFLFDIFIKRI